MGVNPRSVRVVFDSGRNSRNKIGEDNILLRKDKRQKIKADAFHP